MNNTHPFIITPKASKSEKNKGCEDMPEKENQKYGTIRTNRGKGYSETSKLRNNHPTCKPIKLMSYLITLGSREGDTILDPFMGSGTTGIASKQLNRKFIGIEKEPEYIKIAEARIKAVQDNLFQ